MKRQWPPPFHMSCAKCSREVEVGDFHKKTGFRKRGLANGVSQSFFFMKMKQNGRKQKKTRKKGTKRKKTQFFSENETEENRKKREQRKENGKKTRKKRKKYTEENGKAQGRKIGSDTFLATLLRNPKRGEDQIWEPVDPVVADPVGQDNDKRNNIRIYGNSLFKYTEGGDKTSQYSYLVVILSNWVWRPG